MMSVMLQLVKRELLVYMRKPSQFLNPLLFFFVIVSVFPMGMSLENAVIQKFAPGLVWISVLLAALISVDRVFYIDFQNGVLEHQILSDVSITAVVYAKLVVHWAIMTLPLLALSFVIGVMYQFSMTTAFVLILSLLCATPIISVMILILSALSLAAGPQNALLSLIFLPLMTPVLIFGAGAVLIQMQGADPMPILILLLGISLMVLTLGPILIKKGLLIALE